MKTLRFRRQCLGVLLGAGLMQGCIENPEPDSRLGWERRTARTAAFYEGQERLKFRLFEEREGIRLSVSNSGSNRLDSAEFFLELGEWDRALWYAYFRPVPRMDYLGKVGAMWPGEEIDFGIIANPVSGDISDLDFKATILKASESGAGSGHVLGGMYAGTFALLDTTKGWFRGPIQALIDAEGRFGFLETGNQAGSWRYFNGFYAEGRIKQGDSARLEFMRTEYLDRYGLMQLSGTIRPDGDSLIATFILGTVAPGGPADSNGNAMWADSLSVRLGPLLRRRRPGDNQRPVPQTPPDDAPSPFSQQ